MRPSASPRLILLEFNELCPGFLNEFMARGVLPNFKALHDSSTVYITDAEEDPPNLEPWIQWFSMHSGMRYPNHKIYHLGDGRKFDGKLVAELLSDAGVRVGVFGSMNTNYERLNGYFIPDPWDTKASAWPTWLAPFYDTVAKQVQESSRTDAFTKADMAKFGMFLLRHGLRFQTGLATVKQLLDERRNPGLHWRRACALEHISYDLFRWLNRKLDVEFATFFANSTAHFQHYYWRNMEPESFQIPPSEKDDPSLQTAIRYGYESMDRLIGKVLRDYPQSKIILATALSQKPWDTKKCTFRPTKFEQLMQFAGVTDHYEIKPVMAEQFHIVFDSKEAMDRSAALIRQLEIQGRQLMTVQAQDHGLFCGCNIVEYGFMDEMVTSGTGKSERFDKLFYMIHGLRSGRHHPDGAFWVRNRKPAIISQKIPLVNIAPAILGEFGIAVPESMECAKANLDHLADGVATAMCS